MSFSTLLFDMKKVNILEDSYKKCQTRPTPPRSLIGSQAPRWPTPTVVAQPEASDGRVGALATHAVHTTDGRGGGIDEPFQVELLVPKGSLEIGWAPILRAADGGDLLDPTGCGTCPVQLTAGQTVVIEVPFGFSVLHGTPPQSGSGLLPAGREGREGTRWMREVTVQNALR